MMMRSSSLTNNDQSVNQSNEFNEVHCWNSQDNIMVENNIMNVIKGG